MPTRTESLARIAHWLERQDDEFLTPPAVETVESRPSYRCDLPWIKGCLCLVVLTSLVFYVCRALRPLPWPWGLWLAWFLPHTVGFGGLVWALWHDVPLWWRERRGDARHVGITRISTEAPSPPPASPDAPPHP